MKLIDFRLKSGNNFEQEAYWEQGFNYSISAISSLIGVSRSWVDHKLLPELNYVIYEPIFAYNKTSKHILSFVRKDDLADWIKRNSTFECQTELIDLYSYLSKYPTIAYKAYTLYKNNKRIQKGESRPIMPQNVLEYINKTLYADGISSNLNCKERALVPWKEITPFNIFDHTKDLYSFKSFDVTRETMYRRAFLNGDIRIKINDEICLYLKKHHNKMKMPFLIPYDRKIVVVCKG